MRVLLAEDSAVLRDGLARLLCDHGHEIVATTRDDDGIVPAAEQSCPDVAVLDIRMPPTHTDEGLRAALVLRRRHPEIGVLMFSQYMETRYATQLLAENPAGVGYLLKDRVADVRELLITGSFLASLALGLYLQVAYTFTAENFPTRARSSGFALSDGIGHGGGALGALVLPSVVASVSFFAGFAGIGIIGLLAGLIVLLGPRVTRRRLEHISS